LSCDICYRNKPIETYAACCNNKKFCRACYKKLQKKSCPFCRGKIEHDVGEDEICIQTGFQDWLYKISKLKPRIENRVVSSCEKCNVDIRFRDLCRNTVVANKIWCKKCIETPPSVPEKKKIVKRRIVNEAVEPPFQTWRRKINSLQCELLYKAGRCYEHHQDCKCHLEEEEED
jgi:hypothetical protein